MKTPERSEPPALDPDAHNAGSRPTLRIQRVLFVLALMAFALAVIGIVTQYLWLDADRGGAGGRISDEAARLFNLDGEGNIPTWFEGGLLLLSSLLCWLASGTSGPGNARTARGWRVLSAIFVLLSCDEIASIHEAFGTWLGSIVSDSVGIYAWLIGGIPFVLVVGLTLRGFLKDLPQRTSRGLLVAAAIYLGGVVGVEVVEAFLDAYYYATFVFTLVTASEETLEMAGTIVLIGTLLFHLRSAGPTVRVDTR